MRISVIAPVLNEVDFIGYSIMAASPYVHEFVYALDENSSDGTRDLLWTIKRNHLYEKIVILDCPNFSPLDMKAYNAAFDMCIYRSTGDACFFLHPDMILTKGAFLQEGPLAWTTEITSYAGDFQTEITKGRARRWKNIHAKKFGLRYCGGYGSQNEDFYHADITGTSYRHYGEEFSKYPFKVADSGFKINHYCELKPYRRRLEKMKLCLRTLHPFAEDSLIDERAVQHPRVTLEPSCMQFGRFEFKKTDVDIPEVFSKYAAEFEPFKKEEVVANG